MQKVKALFPKVAFVPVKKGKACQPSGMTKRLHHEKIALAARRATAERVRQNPKARMICLNRFGFENVIRWQAIFVLDAFECIDYGVIIDTNSVRRGFAIYLTVRIKPVRNENTQVFKPVPYEYLLPCAVRCATNAEPSVS